MPRTSLLAQWLVLTAISASCLPVLATEHRAFPQLQLAEEGASGLRAIELLGSRLDEIAAWYRRSPEAFRDMLLRDHTMRLDRAGRLYVVDELNEALPLPARASAAAPSTAQTPTTLDKTFKLHSRKGAKRTIYLNFKGAVLTDTAWNVNGSITAKPYDFDGNTNAFSDAELERIQYIWQRVAEDYAPLDIDVTTQAPDADTLTRTSQDDKIYGTTVLITHNKGVYSCSCGGVAYVGVFDYVGDEYKPALVFWNKLGNGDEKYVAEAISHEAGHNLGLSHDGYSEDGYYPGHGSGATGWAPIMGVGYYQSVVQWSQGEYATANNMEDDFVVMGEFGGPLRKDDHGGSISKSSALTASPSGALSLLSGQGVIERRDDQDYFSFAAKAGAGTLTVAPDSRSPNLDVSIKLMDASGKVLVKANPGNALNASLKFTLPAAGTYYLSINGVGIGDPLIDGYSDYGSLGQYLISGSVPSP